MSAHMGRSRSDLAAGPDGSVVKLQMAELNQAVYDLCVDLMGLDGVLYDSFALTRPGIPRSTEARTRDAPSCEASPIRSRAGHRRSSAP